MEVFLGLAVLLAALVLAIAFGKPNGSHPSARAKTQPAAAKSEQPQPRLSGTAAPRFDTVTAKPEPKPRIITGAAYVTDGDTIKIKHTQIRLFGIDAPELEHPYGQKAKWALVKLCKGHKIRAEITEVDNYGRTVAKCYLSDGRDLSAEMVKQGLAIDWPKFSGGKYRRLETPEARRHLWLADARQKGRMDVWNKFDPNRL